MTPPAPSDADRARGFGRPHLDRYLREWAADQREREGWKDADRGTYRFRANVLEAALSEIVAQSESAEELRAEVKRLEAECEGYRNGQLQVQATLSGVLKTNSLLAEDRRRLLAATPAESLDQLKADRLRLAQACVRAGMEARAAHAYPVGSPAENVAVVRIAEQCIVEHEKKGEPHATR
jgi:hypothetical protein